MRDGKYGPAGAEDFDCGGSEAEAAERDDDDVSRFRAAGCPFDYVVGSRLALSVSGECDVRLGEPAGGNWTNHQARVAMLERRSDIGSEVQRWKIAGYDIILACKQCDSSGLCAVKARHDNGQSRCGHDLGVICTEQPVADAVRSWPAEEEQR